MRLRSAGSLAGRRASACLVRGPCLRAPGRRLGPARVTEKEAEKAAIENVDTGLAQITKQLLETDPDARESLRRYEAAVVRLEKAKAASEELDRMFAEAAVGAAASDLQDEEAQRRKGNERMAEAEVAAAERLLQAAELEFAMAQRTREQWATAAADGPERAESVKGALIAAVAGLFAQLPLVLLTSDSGAAASGSAAALSSALSLVAALSAAFLFGVTYRYAVRNDSSNKQLRLGLVAAFGLVRTTGAADVLQAAAAGAGGDGSPLSLAVIGPAALYALESMLLFGFASVAIEAAFSQGFLKRFGDA
ncbi:hypothetical protein TSOC_010662 [Tetrabaena socialis]|uniref:Uncharacterized protein n=1 Tax=Tetrabaena socialis TaxID=47790 RepID=A0A2J7ZSP5_9CHLO|nr:hypothetical protein TSOC_010662 [Tetrabaena socialis]|eukprot:PNH03293.1 hypothetical protein TSOC_010662 [Tetrabaena socialis]